MILKTLVASNFYSFKHLEINFADYRGIVYVKGTNKDTGGSNGSGKSSLCEMVSFGLFGKTIRKSTEEALINVDSKKNLRVTIEAEKPGVGTALIVRTKKPTSLNFFLNGEDLTQENANKTQELIESTLGINYKTYSASIIFGQHSDIDFLSATADDKRLIIRNFLNLDKLFGYRDSIKELKSKFSTGSKVCATVIQELASQAKDLESRIVNTKPVKLTETYEQVSERQKKIEELRKKRSLIQDEANSLSKKHQDLTKEIAKGVYSHKDTCKVCKKVYTKKQTQSQVKSLTSKSEKLKKKLLKLTEQATSQGIKIANLSRKMNVTEWVKRKEEYDNYLAQKKLKEDHSALLAKIESREAEKNENDVQYEVMRFWEKAFSEQGLVKYFIRNILDYLNFKVNEYLSILTNNQFTMRFSEELDETIHNNGRQLSYISLSGGEKRKINLAVMLALQSLLTHTSKEQSNIIFFDEVAENMDEDGCVGIFNLLKALKDENKTVFLITHNAYLKSLLTGCQIVNIQKKNGESVLL